MLHISWQIVLIYKRDDTTRDLYVVMMVCRRAKTHDEEVNELQYTKILATLCSMFNLYCWARGYSRLITKTHESTRGLRVRGKRVGCGALEGTVAVL